MFAYCGNDPVNRIDESGKYWFAAATCIVGFIVGGVSQIATNALDGKDVSQWGEGVMGAAFGGGAYGLVTGFGVNPIAAGYIGACAESFVNEAVDYMQGIKKGSTDNIISSIYTVACDTLAGGTYYAVTGTIAAQVIPTTFGGKDTVEFLTQGAEMGKAWGQSIYQSSMVMIKNIGNTISNRYLAPKKASKQASKKTSKKISKPSSRRSTRPVALVA